jgi:hypothetical protein
VAERLNLLTTKPRQWRGLEAKRSRLQSGPRPTQAIRALKEHGLPKRLSGRAFTTLLGDEGRRMGAHFMAMGWVDQQDRPTEELVALVEAFGSNSWREALDGMIRGTYAFVPEPWEDLTGETLREAFITHTRRAESQMIAQAETFFLSLALECGVQLTERLYFRAERAHNLVGKRTRDEEDTPESGEPVGKTVHEKPVISQVNLGDEVKDQLKAFGTVAESLERVSAILTLSTLLGDSGLTDQEVKAIRITLSVLGRTNAA